MGARYSCKLTEKQGTPDRSPVPVARQYAWSDIYLMWKYLKFQTKGLRYLGYCCSCSENKSDVKCQNILGCLGQYMAPNCRSTGVECPHPHKCYLGSNGLDLELGGPVIAEFWHPQDSKRPYYAHGHAHVIPMDKWPWCCTSTGPDSSNELNLEWIGPVAAELQHMQGSESTYHAHRHTNVALMGKWQRHCTSTG